MSLNTVLVPMGGADTTCDDTALCSALTFANKMGAHVDALHVQQDPRNAAAFVGEGMTTAMIENVIELAEKDATERSKKAEQLFNDICTKKNIPVEDIPKTQPGQQASAWFLTKVGSQEDLMTEYGRMVDMLVACKKSEDHSSDNEQALNAAILETGRPVLVVDHGLDSDFGKKIAVIWNGSVQSSRALTAALPLLKQADQVTVICAIDDLSEEISPEMALRYLKLHGIEAESRNIKSGSGSSTAQSLMDAAKECDADMMVMGAYTRGRLRRLFFGAVTGAILAKCSLPVFMAH